MNETLLEKLDRERITLASFDKRVTAFLLDEILVSIIVFIAFWGKFSSVSTDFEQMVLIISSLSVHILLIKFIYHAFFVWYYGATPGKMIVKIRCIDAIMLCSPNLSNSILRSAVRIFSEIAFYLGFAWAFGNKERQTWQDKVAKTVVCNAY